MIKPIPDFPGYWATDDGRIWSASRNDSLGRFYAGKWLRPSRDNFGYLGVILRRDGGSYARKFHRLVLEAFVGPRPDGMEACHNNGDPSDNRLENLRWDTRSANHKDAVRHGTMRPPGLYGEQCGRAKLNERQVRQIIYICRTGLFRHYEVAAQYGVYATTVTAIMSHKTWKHLWT